MLKETEKNILEELHAKNQTMTGICFTLAMRNDDGEIELHERIDQPCYGELRKYKSTHGKEATQPENRPGDLRNPFPKGTPEALAIGLPEWFRAVYDPKTGRYVGSDSKLIDENQRFFDYIFGDSSPFIRGFGGSQNVEWSPGKKGIVLHDLSIDPTILVNLLKYLQVYPKHDGLPTFCTYLDDGLTEIEAFIASYCCNYGGSIYVDRTYKTGLTPVYDYIFPVKTDLGRILSQDPVDLTGGTLRDRFDYSRKNLHKIFYSGDGINFYKEIIASAGLKENYRVNGVVMTKEDFLKNFKIVLNREINKLQERKAA